MSRRAPPPLTVALLTYNRLHYLKEAVEAILGQSYRTFELLVLDNGSTDGTGAFILGLSDPRIRYVRNSVHYSTVEFNCCSAFHIAIGKRVIVTHDDDIMEPDMLERQMAFMDAHPEVRLAWTRVSDIDQDGRAIPGSVNAPEEDRVFGPGEYIASFLRERLWPMPSGVMLERACLPRLYSMESPFREAPRLKNPMDVAGIADVLLPARVNRRHAIGYIGAPLLRRRVHTNQFSHAASLSRPGVYLYRRLKRVAGQVPGGRPDALHFDAFVERFDIQELITTQARARVGTGVVDRVARATAKLKANLDASPDAFLAGLPIVMLHDLLTPGERFAGVKRLSAQGHGSATRQLLRWAQARADDASANLLAPLAGRRVVVFGSAFIAALLVLEARRGGCEVLACLDSNVNRQGRSLLGVPIHALDWMREHVGPEDVVLVSSERDHEHYIEALIRQHLAGAALIISWKDLVDGLDGATRQQHSTAPIEVETA
ncbi:glycosyltransferase family 2 protein [Metapseudomonas furukawaii]